MAAPNIITLDSGSETVELHESRLDDLIELCAGVLSTTSADGTHLALREIAQEQFSCLLAIKNWGSPDGHWSRRDRVQVIADGKKKATVKFTEREKYFTLKKRFGDLVSALEESGAVKVTKKMEFLGYLRLKRVENMERSLERIKEMVDRDGRAEEERLRKLEEAIDGIQKTVASKLENKERIETLKRGVEVVQQSVGHKRKADEVESQ